MNRRMKILLPMLVMLALVGIVFNSMAEESESPDAAKIERGRYLVMVAGCNDCHTPKIMTDMGPVLDSSRLLSGQPASEKVGPPPANLGEGGWVVAGNPHFTAWTGDWGVSFAANLTSDKKTGLGNWTDEQFIKTMRTGKHRGFGRPILPPMPWFNLAPATDEDLSAILSYLKSTKPIENKVPDPIPPAGK